MEKNRALEYSQKIPYSTATELALHPEQIQPPDGWTAFHPSQDAFPVNGRHIVIKGKIEREDKREDKREVTIVISLPPPPNLAKRALRHFLNQRQLNANASVTIEPNTF